MAAAPGRSGRNTPAVDMTRSAPARQRLPGIAAAARGRRARRDNTAMSVPEPRLPSRLLEGLNPEQLAAVTLPPEPALILAGAGSGKTRVLTTRIAWLIQTGQLSPGGVLAVTFTNKAAKEMLTRLDAMLPIPVRGMWIGTFHGLCNRFLRAHWKLAALPQGFQILDSADQLSAVKRVMKAMNLDEERHVPKQVTWVDRRPPRTTACAPRTSRCATSRAACWSQVYQAYDEQCQREGVVDFAELMLRTYELMRDNAALREHYQRRFRHILVDEFQDTNKLQYAWLKMFAGPPEQGCALFAVGDDDQSIYAFRGAQVGNMAAFEREYRVEHRHQAGAQLPLLRQHPRRRQRADRAATRAASARTCAPRPGPGEPVRVHEAPSTSPRRSGSSRRRSSCTARARRATRSRCSTAATRRAG